MAIRTTLKGIVFVATISCGRLYFATTLYLVVLIE